MPVLGDHAVVLGASMGGLLAARVLADFYRTVTVIERDELPDDPVTRKGVPQGRHRTLFWRVARTSWTSSFPGCSTSWLPPARRFWTTAICPGCICPIAAT